MESCLCVFWAWWEKLSYFLSDGDVHERNREYLQKIEWIPVPENLDMLELYNLLGSLQILVHIGLHAHFIWIGGYLKFYIEVVITRIILHFLIYSIRKYVEIYLKRRDKFLYMYHGQRIRRV